MIALPSRAALLATTLAFVSSLAAAGALTVGELQALLRSAPRAAIPFQEVRESPWLQAPAASSGTLRGSEKELEKRVELPQRETWRLLPDRVEWIGPAGGPPKQILFRETPALAPVSDVIRRLVAGDMEALQHDFRIELSGDARVWRATMTPRTPAIDRLLERIEIQGTGNRLQVIIVSERNGQKTTTRLFP